MHKNPFVPPPSYPTHQQPPLPPGPPPPQPAGQPDYSAYWASQQQPGVQPAYNPQWPGQNPQWSAPQGAQVSAPPKPATDQSAALYANYGYGGHQSALWQQQHAQQQQHHYAQPPASVAPPLPPQTYNPYQPQSAATYAQPPQPYFPQGPPQPQTPAHQPYRPVQPPQGPQQPYFQQQQQQQQQHPRAPANSMQQSSPQQQMPPAKRPRFDNHSTPHQPRFQQSAQAMSMQGVPSGPSKQSGMAGLPSQPSQMQSQGSFSGGMGRGGMTGGRGSAMNRSGRGGSMGPSRGTGMNRGRGGNLHGSAGRGGSGHSGGSGSMRGHQSRDRGSFSNFNRRGGSFSTNGPQHHQNNLPARSGHGGRMHGGHGGRSGRSDGYNSNRGLANASNTGSGSGLGKREENRRTLTDFKIVGLEIRSLGWHWGYIPPDSDPVKPKDEEITKKEENSTPEPGDLTEGTREASGDSTKHIEKDTQSAHLTSNGAAAARMRIYFHTPPSADDARPIAQISSVSDVRKGKRKKVDDDEGDLEDGMRPPPHPPLSNGAESTDSRPIDALHPSESAEHDASAGRASVAPSIAETASEDWLMAAIVDGDADAEGEMDIYEQTQVEDEVDGHEVDGHYEVDETSVGSKAQQDTVETRPDVNAAGNGQEEISSQDEPSAPPLNAASSGEFHVRKGKEIEASVLQAGNHADAKGHVESSNPKAEKEVGGTDSFSVKEETVELIVSSVDSSTEDPHGNEEKSSQANDAAVKEETDGSDKPQTIETEHLPEPPASPTSNTAFSGSSASTSTVNPDLPAKPGMSSARVASANRVSIAYAAGSRRLLVDAEVVDKLTVFRAEGRIDIDMTVERAEGRFKGILIETLNESKAYSPIAELSKTLDSDPTLPPFWKAESVTKAVINVYLDKDRPLSEPKWVKTGDVQDWLKDMFGGRFWVAGEAVGWEKKIEVRYPDPAPTIQTVLGSWSNNSPVGVASERSRFVKTHMTDANNVLEILLRLVRGERATPFSQNSSAISTTSIQGPLLGALDSSSPHAAQQTHVSLAVVALVRLAADYAEKALGDGKGKEQVDERVGEIIRYLPSHLLYKSLDGMFKEWRSEKKNGR